MHVAVRPVVWFERTSWGETERRMPPGECVRIDVMVCQVQARLGRNPRSNLVTFELVLGTDRQTWTCRSMAAIWGVYGPGYDDRIVIKTNLEELE